MSTATTPKTFTSQQAKEAVQHHRKEAIREMKKLIEELTKSLKRMEDGANDVSNNPETQLAQVRQEASKAQLMQRLHEHLENDWWLQV